MPKVFAQKKFGEFYYYSDEKSGLAGNEIADTELAMPMPKLPILNLWITSLPIPSQRI